MSAKRKTTPSESNQPPKKTFHWSQGLLASMDDPELRISEDDDIVIIKDKYPKAKYHFLLLSKENISSLKAVNSSHLPLLRHMQKEGESLAKRTAPESTFLIGYHAVPSMSRLHLHVISNDFDSVCLKNKKHWNSFTSSFFIPSKDVIKEIEKEGKFIGISQAEANQLLNTPLRCHLCKSPAKTLPALKLHVKSHFKK